MNDPMDVDPPHFQQINSEGLCQLDKALLNNLIHPETLLSARTRPALGEYFMSSDGYVKTLVWSTNYSGFLHDNRWREFLGPIRDQRLHLLCWCYASTDLFSAESIMSGWEDEYHPLCTWHLCATCRPDLLGTAVVLETDEAAQQRQGHLCYGHFVFYALHHIRLNGIPREIRSEFPCSINPPQSLIIPGERIQSIHSIERLEEALYYLSIHPIGADVIYFDGLFDRGSDIYYGPKASNVCFKGYHAVIIESVTHYRGDIVAICKMSNGVHVANEGYVYVSLTTMFMHTEIDSSRRPFVRETARPHHLLSNFVILTMHERRKREQPKKVEVKTEKTEEKDVNEDTEQAETAKMDENTDDKKLKAHDAVSGGAEEGKEEETNKEEEVKEENKEEEVEEDTEVDEPKVEDKQTESKDENENEINDSKDENEDIEEGTKDEKEDEKEESMDDKGDEKEESNDDKEDKNEDIKKRGKQGKETPLKDIPNVAYKESRKKSDEVFKQLHTILFGGRRGKATQIKANILRFLGYKWQGDEEDETTR